MEATPAAAFIDTIQRLQQLERSFAVATVISVRGSASARPGSKAIFNEEGHNIWGWVGGGCAERYVGEQALETLQDGQTRIVQADLDDEVFGLGMPCGGVMDIFIEPHLPAEIVTVRESRELRPILEHLAKNLGLRLSLEDSTHELPLAALERSLYSLARGIAAARGASFESLRKVKEVSPCRTLYKPQHEMLHELLVVGSSRITEELAKFAAVAKWNVRVYGWNLQRGSYPLQAELEEIDAGYANFKVKPGSAVVIASHHRGDHEYMRRALAAGANYVGLIASRKRSLLVCEHLTRIEGEELPEDRIYAPSGLDLGCHSPAEIALSCMAEILLLKAAAF